MILADTSVWIDHLRSGDQQFASELERGLILMHPFIAGELALGSLGSPSKRAAILRDLDSLPKAKLARNEEVRLLIERQSLFSLGIGYVDANLLASVLLTPGTLLWTRDKRLRRSAESLQIHVAFA
jgi:predicted nucleic acid-binding protein